MGIGEGESRPYAPKKPDKDELNVEDLYREFRNLQRRNKWLRGVRLELVGHKAEGGESGHMQPSYMEQDKDTGRYIMRPPTLRLFLPALKEAHEIYKPYPKPRGGQHTSLGRDFTKYVREVLRHEVAHALNQQRQAISGRPDEPVTPKEAIKKTKLSKSRLRPASEEKWPENVHMKMFQLYNRMLQGSGARPRFEKIGLPDEFMLPVYRGLSEKG